MSDNLTTMIFQLLATLKKCFNKNKILLALAAIGSITLFLESCRPDNPPSKNPIRYEIDEFIFNTFLFSQGSWWALVDTASGDRDTLMITESIAQHQNVYEGTEFKYYRFYYQGKLWSTSKQELRTILYTSNSFADYTNERYPQIRVYLNGRPWSFFINDLNVGDSIPTGGTEQNGSKELIHFTLQDSGDSLDIWKFGWAKGKYVKFKQSNVYFEQFSDLTFVFQEHFGLVSYKSNGALYIVEDSHILPVVR